MTHPLLRLSISCLAIAALAAGCASAPRDESRKPATGGTTPVDYFINQAHCLSADAPSFDPKASSFSISNAYWLGILSRVSYAPESEAVETARTLGFQDVEFLDVTHARIKSEADETLGEKARRALEAHENKQPSYYGSTQALWAEGPDYAVLAFRGTDFDGLSDVMTDIDAGRQIEVPHLGRVHEGFLQAVELGWKWIKEHADRLGPDKKLFITGHSLGGALATLATGMLLEEDRAAVQAGKQAPYRIAGSYSFASPRIGNAEFVREILEDYRSAQGHGRKVVAARFMNPEDAVTMVPTKARLSNIPYASDMSDLVYFTDDHGMLTGAQAVKTAPPHLISLLRDKRKIVGWWHDSYYLSQHSMERYLYNLSRQLDLDKDACIPEENRN